MAPTVSLVQTILLALFLLSTPVAVVFAFYLQYDRVVCAIINSYAFSLAMVGLYLYPLLLPLLDTKVSAERAIDMATMNWIVWLSVFTEIAFQIPHNLMVRQLEQGKGSSFEWPFFTYGLSDSRWNNYHGGSGLDPEVWLININDAGLGILVLVALLYYRTRELSKDKCKAKIAFVLMVVFRDATLWRETVEYLWDHHRYNYPYTTTDVGVRSHAIILLWLVNIVWLIAPCMSVVWAYTQLSEGNSNDNKIK